MAAIRNVKNVNLFILYQLLCSTLEAEGVATFQPCIGKHQFHSETEEAFEKNMTELLELKGFEEVPIQTFLERNDHLVFINFVYDDAVPVIKLNFESFLSVKGTFRFRFLYFEWFEQTRDSLSVTFPGELHAVFYDENAKGFDRAAATDKGLIVLAFGIKMDPLASSNFIVLRKHFAQMQDSENKVSIPNQNLKFWLNADMKEFFVFEGSLTQFDCRATVIWMDIVDHLTMPPDVVNMFADLNVSKVDSIMNHSPQSVKPKGKIFFNSLAAAKTEGILFIDEENAEIYKNDASKLAIAKDIGVSVVLCFMFLMR